MRNYISFALWVIAGSILTFVVLDLRHGGTGTVPEAQTTTPTPATTTVAEEGGNDTDPPLPTTEISTGDSSGSGPGPEEEPSPLGSAELVRDGIRVRFTAAPVGSGGRPIERDEIIEGDAVRLTFRVEDALTGEGLRGMHIASWLCQRPGDLAPDRTMTENLVRMLLQGKLQSGEATSLNSYYYLSLNDDNSLCMLDPLLDFNRTRLRRIASLESTGEDLLVTPDGTLVFVTMPCAGKTAVIDALSMQVVTSVPTGIFPRDITLQPDEECAWVVDALGDTIHGLDLASGEEIAKFTIGAGEKDLLFDRTERQVAVIERTHGRVTMLPFLTAHTRKSATSELHRLGRPVRSAAFGELARRIYLLTEGGTVEVLDAASGELVRSIESDASGPLVADPQGRFLYLIDSAGDAIHLIDTSNDRITRSIDVGRAPQQISFTDGYAQVYCTGSRSIRLIGRSVLGQPGPLPVLEIPVGEVDPEEPRKLGVGPMVAPTPERTSVLVAIPEEQQLYYYSEGMGAPMGSYRNFSRTPLAIAVLDRSLREGAAGTYSIVVRADRAGTFDIPFYLGQPTEILHRFEIAVTPNEATIAEREANRVRAVPTFVDAPDFAYAQDEVTVRIRLDDPEVDATVEGVRDLQVLVYQLPGSFQRRRWAEEVEPGIYEATVKIGSGGGYRIRCQTVSQKLTLPLSAEHRFTVSDDVVTTIDRHEEGGTP